MKKTVPVTALLGILGMLSLVVLVGCEAKRADSAPAANSGTKSAATAPAAPAGGSESHFAKVITEASFEADVLTSDQVVMVDFWAPWCGPCRTIAPSVEEIAKEYEGKAVIAKLDVDNAQAIATKYEVNGIPALLFFKNGEVVDRIVGAQPKEQIVDKLKSVMGN